jgi:hypothetical protein
MKYKILMEAIGKVPGGRFVVLAETTDKKVLARLVRAVKKAAAMEKPAFKTEGEYLRWAAQFM